MTSVAISPDGRLVAAGSLDTVVRLWDVQTGQLIERLVGHKDSVYSVAFTPDGKGLVSGSLDCTLKHWDLGMLMRGGRGGSEKGGQSEKGSACTGTFTGHKVGVDAVTDALCMLIVVMSGLCALGGCFP